MSRQHLAENLLDEPLKRSTTSITSTAPGIDHFVLGPKNATYKHQYANIYFYRLNKLRNALKAQAQEKWGSLDPPPMLRSRVLEVDKGESCYIVGTVYLDMPLKPNVLEDVARDQSLPAPPRPRKIYSPEDAVNLEDESGRIKLHGDVLSGLSLVTGMILGVLGHENDNGEFEVEDYCFAGVAPQDILEEHMDIDGEDIGEWIAFVSGLSIGSDRPDDTKFEIRLQLLSEFLSGDLGTSISQRLGARISRLMILGNSLAPYDPTTDVTENLAAQRGNPVRNKPPPKGLPITTEQHPLHILDKYLLELSHSMPIHLLPGNLDPSSTALPQQPFPKGMFRSAKKSKNLHSHTNPTWLGVNGCSVLAGSGQALDDMFMYLPDPPESSHGSPESSLRLSLLQATLRCRHLAPTAPDTLHCFPYMGHDPFLLTTTPHIYAMGNQPSFESQCFTEDGVRSRLVCVPSFAESGELVLVNTHTLAAQVIELNTKGFQKRTK